MRPKSINVFKWIAILPAVAKLVDDAWAALADHKVDAAEAQRLGEDFLGIVAVVKDQA